LCKLELWLTKKFGASPLICQLFEANMYTHGHTLHGIKYKVDGTRKSGDPFTSLFNSVLNGLMHIYAFKVKYDEKHGTNLYVHQLRTMIKMVVQGDDNLMIHSGPKMPEIKDVLYNLGFDCECNYRDSIYDCEFCSNIIYDTKQGPTFGPKIGRVISKLGYFISPPTHVHPMSMLRGVALGLEATASYVPYINVVVKRILKDTKGYSPYFEKTYDFKMVYKKREAVKNDYVLWNRYGITGDIKRRIDEGLATETKLYDIKYHLLFDRDTDAEKYIFVTAA